MKTAMEQLERMEALVRRMANSYPEPRTGIVGHDIQCHYTEANAIVAELPVPVDPDLIEAREIAADKATIGYGGGGGKKADEIRSGKFDESPDWGVNVALAAIKRGRELERQGK